MRTRLIAASLFASMSSFAWGQSDGGGTLYGVELGADILAKIDPATVSASVVGPLGTTLNMTGLAADPVANTIYAVTPNNGGLYRINPATGLATVLAPGLFTANANALAFDPSTGANGRLFVAELNTNALHSYDIATGTPTFLSTISGATAIEGLAFDTTTGTLYGLSDGVPEGVYKIDPGSGQTSLLATMTSTGLWRGLDIDSATGTLYATRVNPSMLTKISVVTGAVSDLGPIAGIGAFVQGLAWMGEAGCYPDCNNSGTLTIADFGCFQAAFAAGDPYADCNNSSSLTIADFGCFQAAFAAGCP